MALLQTLLQAIVSQPYTSMALMVISVFISISFYRICLHPIAHIPGPLICKITPLWLYYHSYIGDEASIIHNLHSIYGPALRVAPNNVDISDADAVQPIYVTGGGFAKAECYSNFDIDGHKTIFSTTETAYRTPRVKAVVPMFSTASLRVNLPKLYECTDRMVDRLKEESRGTRPVNVLSLTRSLAIDMVSTHLFGINYNGTEEKTEKLSVSLFVDAFVAVGRFFYLPNLVFVWVEWVIDKVYPNEKTYSSMVAVDRFVNNLVDKTSKEDTNYPGRLKALGVVETEVKAQCKDLIFAGTDSTGMNLATIIRCLVLKPEWLQKIRQELEDNRVSSDRADIQSLPLLSATIREGLRISMANPTRLPRMVPTAGWEFKGIAFPAGTDVGCAAYSLHYDERVFPDPRTFSPSRWLTEDTKHREEMNKYWFAFGAGSRSCIAKNMATLELFLATERIVESGVLNDAKACQEMIKIYEWFNSSVKGERIEIVWNGRSQV